MTSRIPPAADIVRRLREAGCVFAEDEAELLNAEAVSPMELERMVDQRVSGMPIEYVVGWAAFCGLRIVVEPGVFVPRRRTEFLVEQAVARVQAGAVVVDLCCGSGAVGAAVASLVHDIDLTASDLDPVAVDCARRNLAPLGASVFQGDLFDAVPDGLAERIDVLVVNVPYVPTDEIATLPQEARLHEPRLALDGGSDGLDVARRVIAGAPTWLAPGGVLLIEASEEQAPQAEGACISAGLQASIAWSEELPTAVVIGVLSNP